MVNMIILTIVQRHLYTFGYQVLYPNFDSHICSGAILKAQSFYTCIIEISLIEQINYA